VLIKFFFIGRIINENYYDVINIHSCSWQYILLLKRFKKSAARLVITFYGSDFYRTSDRVKKLQIPLYMRADALTFTNPATKESFLQYYKKFEQKSFVCRFGLKTLDYIDKNRNENKSSIRRYLGYKTDKTIVTCGYNSTQAQQHMAIILALKKLDQVVLSEVQFIFPLTYGDSSYKEEVKKLLNESTLDYIVLEDFLYKDDNACIKLASDIMINILETDSFSGSMQEFLYAGNVVITGQWLPYGLFDKNGVRYEKIENTDGLADKINYCIKHLNELQQGLGDNEKIIRKLSGWSANIQDWIDAYTFDGKRRDC
jgi:glycosyltransferase involved in cell wall biosynthesis